MTVAYQNHHCEGRKGTLKAIAGGAGHLPCIATRGNKRHESSGPHCLEEKVGR